jgi:NAD(P)-dependent dehydrogenase (short-subunit alcohol dehydrogenase family)
MAAMEADMRLQDRIAIVTGAGSGNGRAIAIGMAREGADVIIPDVNQQGAEATAQDIAALGRQTLVLHTDVSKLSDIEAMVKATMDRFGRIDILVNNAGVIVRQPMLEVTEETWDRILDINLKGVFFCTQAVARVMIRQGRGKIINIASIAGVRAEPRRVHYNTSKAGVIMLTKSTAVELAPYHINVNAIGPGLIETPMTRDLIADIGQAKYWQESIPWGRIGKPEDLVGAAIFLASDEAEYITGVTIFVDGGFIH